VAASVCPAIDISKGIAKAKAAGVYKDRCRPAHAAGLAVRTCLRATHGQAFSVPSNQTPGSTPKGDPSLTAPTSRAGGRRGCRSVSQRGYLAMKAIRSITPREAKAVWDSLKSPSARSVARAMTQAGRRVHHSTIARWNAQDWRPVAHGPHPLEAARQALDIAVGVLTGDPVGGMEILERRPEREQLDGLSDSEILRRSARQLCIATILACHEFQECASTLVAENPAEAGLLLKALCRAVQAATAAYGEALKSRDHPRPQDNDGTPSNDPLVDLLKRFEAASKK
jgi:hypothetical protein